MTTFEQWVALAIGVPMLVVAVYSHAYLVRNWLGNRHKDVDDLEKRMFTDEIIPKKIKIRGVTPAIASDCQG